MEAMINKDESVRGEIVKELVELGCCNLCILRYLGNTDPYTYRMDESRIKKLIFKDSRNDIDNGIDNQAKVTELNDGPALKVLKRIPCTTCLGLLDKEDGASEVVLDKLVSTVKGSGIQAKSYTINLSLPVSVQFRAYFVWFHLLQKFSSIYFCFPTMKPEGVCLKNAWKWICTGKLKEKIDPESEWTTDGCFTVNVTLLYEADETECLQLSRQVGKRDKSKSGALSRGAVDTILKDLTPFDFKRKFGDKPPVPSKSLVVSEIKCVHVPVYIAGRYCKYSRNVSQTPWIIDGKRFHDGSVEELIADHVLLLMEAEQEKFSASGREDVDTRMLGEGRPFIMEVLNPKRTIFMQADINKLRDRINASTKLIRVRDLQLVEKKTSNKLKEGEEFKTKTYCALCLLPKTEVTPEILDTLNKTPVPLVLQQKTPIRVLHRRSLLTRERSIYSIKAVPGMKTKNLFKLYVQTQAGTYVKEFVHGDLGRTTPCVSQIVGCDVDIVSLDVESVDFSWPPTIPE